MSKPVKKAMRVETNLQPGQELRVDPRALAHFLKPSIEKFLAKKKAEQDASAVTNSGN